ncbi:MAG: tetratricopeptide repeat protein [Bryobacteraceae bacterium]|nr:tetratricopeptide repeat protein [Bryobacteraceae bacterium]
MLADQFKILAWFYVHPKRAASAALDQGKFLFALLAAVAVTLAISVASDGERFREEAALGASAHYAQHMKAEEAGKPDPPATAEFMRTYPARRELIERRYFLTGLKAPFLMAVVFVPVCILILTALAQLGGGVTILFRDFMPVLVGLLFCWAVAHAPVAVGWWLGFGGVPLQAVGLVYFLALATFVFSTVMGVSLAQAAGAEIGGVAASLGAALLMGSSGNILYMFASPWLLYMAYQMFGRDIGALGGGLAARQRFKRQLEFATLNPRDADAHYQLGLLYAQRRAFTEAEQSFRRALAIDPNEPDALFQLGRLLRQQGHDAEARDLLERGAQLDPKLASHQVWRELGAVALAGGQANEAATHLGYYVNVREYDPEGLVLYGRALRALERPAEARSAFERAIEAVETAPRFRRGELAPFARQARQELKQ